MFSPSFVSFLGSLIEFGLFFDEHLLTFNFGGLVVFGGCAVGDVAVSGGGEWVEVEFEGGHEAFAVESVDMVDGVCVVFCSFKGAVDGVDGVECDCWGSVVGFLFGVEVVSPFAFVCVGIHGLLRLPGWLFLLNNDCLGEFVFIFELTKQSTYC